MLDNGLIEPAVRHGETSEGVEFTQASYYAITEKGKKALREYLLEAVPRESELYQEEVKRIGRIGLDVAQE